MLLSSNSEMLFISTFSMYGNSLKSWPIPIQRMKSQHEINTVYQQRRGWVENEFKEYVCDCDSDKRGQNINLQGLLKIFERDKGLNSAFRPPSFNSQMCFFSIEIKYFNNLYKALNLYPTLDLLGINAAASLNCTLCVALPMLTCSLYFEGAGGRGISKELKAADFQGRFFSKQFQK